MQEISVENILSQIAQLPLTERRRLRQLFEQQEEQQQPPGTQPARPPLDRRFPPNPIPGGAMRALQWIAEHAREYAGQWVALDGDRLIAHGKDARKVYAAANADGAYLPLVDLIEDPDDPITINFG
jgi:Family of unknown function (DUF5678)